MDLLMVMIALIGIAVSIANKKNAAKAQKNRPAPQNREAVGPKAAPLQRTQSRTSPSKAPSKYPSASPSSTNRQPAAAQETQPRVAPSYGGTPRYTHTVMSTLEGGHTHTESSMTGEEDCPPPRIVPVAHEEAEQPAAASNALLDFQANSVLQGILYAEILGKPKALQRD